MTQFVKDIFVISAADIKVKCLFSITQDVIIYCWNWLNLNIIKNIMLIKYYNMFILAAEVIKRIEERFILIIIINSNEKNSSADKLNSTVTKLYIELLLNYYFSDNDLYNDSDYKNNINFRLYNYD